MKRQGRLWYVCDGSMYVYYLPTHWKPLIAKPKPEKASDPSACFYCGGIGPCECYSN